MPDSANSVAASRSSGNFFVNFAHRVVIIFGGFSSVRLWIGRKTHCHGLYVCFLAGRGIRGKVRGLLNGFVSFYESLVACRIVVIRADGFGDSPIRNCEFRIKFGGVSERTRGFVVIEGIDQAQTLDRRTAALADCWSRRVMQVSQSRTLTSRVCFDCALDDLAQRRSTTNKATTRRKPAAHRLNPPSFAKEELCP